MLTRNKRSRKILKKQNKWIYYPKIYDISEIKGKRQSKPYKFKVDDLWSLFSHNSIQELLADRLLDIVASYENSFTGNTITQETMTFQQFQNYNGPLTLYLAQIQLDIQCPKILNDEGNVFLWCSKGFTDSGWHYDSYENYLGVVQGIKIVYLRKKCANWQKFESVSSEQYNHIKKGQKMQGKFVVLQKNEFLYIPQGMFHRVVSYDATIGVNVWMESIKNTTVKANHYQLRYILNELIQKEMKKQLIQSSEEQLKNLNIKKYKQDISEDFKNFQKYLSVHRNSKQKPLNLLISIYLCLLASMNNLCMVKFLLMIEEIIPLNFFKSLPLIYQAIIAMKLDEFSESIENPELRDSFYQKLQNYNELMDSLKECQIQFKNKIACLILTNHLKM